MTPTKIRPFLSLLAVAAFALPLTGSANDGFTRNDGQWPDSILYRASTPEAEIAVTRRGLIYEFTFIESARDPRTRKLTDHGTDLGSDLAAYDEGIVRVPEELRNAAEVSERFIVSRQFVGSHEDVVVQALEPYSFRTNYFTGGDPSQYRTQVPTFRRIIFRNLYDNIDVALSYENGVMSEERINHESADESVVRIETVAAMSASARPDYTAQVSDFVQSLVFDGLCLAANKSTTSRDAGLASVSALTREFSTYLGAGSDDEGRGVAVGPDGGVYVCGYSLDYSTTQSPTPNFNGDSAGVEAFVYKYSAAGDLVYRTFFGGKGIEVATDVVINAANEVLLTGYTNSTNFSAFSGGRDTTRTDYDGFLIRLNAVGNNILNIRYFGGTDDEYPVSIARDASGSPYVAGYTYSSDYPLRSQYQGNLLDGDAFVTKFNPTDTGIVYSTYVGGNRHDEAYGIAVDGSGSAYIVGTTYSRDFPDTRALSDPLTGADLFVAKLNPAGSTIGYALALRCTQPDVEAGEGIAVDSAGVATIVGQTSSPANTLRLVSSAGLLSGFSDTIIGDTTGLDLLIARINQSGTGFVYSRLIGGDGDELASGVAIHSDGSASIVATSRSTNFPVIDSVSGYPDTSGQNIVVARLNPAGNALTFSTYLGGALSDFGRDIASDSVGNVYVTGFTNDTSAFLLAPGLGYQGGIKDAFLTKLSPVASPGPCAGGDGNVDCDAQGEVDLIDLTTLVDFLFISFESLGCPANAEIDGVGEIDLIDLTLLVDHLFISFAPLPGCE